jgi:hypothetical protein
MVELMDPQALSNIISLVLVVVTGVYVFLTWRIANSNQKMIERLDEQHREEVRPNVFAHLEFRAQVVVGLVIENMGRSPAYDLRVSISDDFLQFAGESGKNLKDMSLFTDPIEWFPPGAKIAVDLSQGFNFDKTDESGNNITPSRFLIELDYKSTRLSP